MKQAQHQPPGPSYWLQGSIHRAGQQQDNTNHHFPLSLDGRGIKGEGENDATHSPRHCGLDPQSRREAAGHLSFQHPSPSFPRRLQSTGQCDGQGTRHSNTPILILKNKNAARTLWLAKLSSDNLLYQVLKIPVISPVSSSRSISNAFGFDGNPGKVMMLPANVTI